ncbi:ALF repeat-containing protein [Streptomyces sp. NRRL F-5126]|uniref:ALF repeat-containing protein n=1 Tax=Streptomyces sp. NRRL F-5126 TaxID=1463857 RepID=UPI0004C97924|nr:ALF repeat-containing protein [Streptomyces sp. NRRL F-5126]
MRPTHTALTIAAAALAPALLFATPAFAAGFAATPSASAVSASAVSASGTDGSTTPVDEMSDDDVRVAIFRILADPDTGKSVHAAAQAALEGTIEDQRTFLETGFTQAQFEDDSVAVFTILGHARENNDKAVIREADKALEIDTPESVRTFLETGYRLAQAEDDSVAIFHMLADPTISDALRTAAQKALDDGSPEALRYFLEHGQYEVDAS